MTIGIYVGHETSSQDNDDGGLAFSAELAASEIRRKAMLTISRSLSRRIAWPTFSG